MTENKIDKKDDNQVVYFTKLNWIIFFWPLVILCLACVVDVWVPLLHELCMVIVLCSLIWTGVTWINYYFSSLTVKRKSVILRTGLFIRKTVDMPLSKIETIDIRQSILGGVLRYGTLIITGTGGTRHLINYLDKPLTCRRYIEQLMNEGA